MNRGWKEVTQNGSDDFVVGGVVLNPSGVPNSMRCHLIGFIYSLKGKQSPLSAVKVLCCSSGLLPADGDGLLSVFLAVRLSAEKAWFQPEVPADSLHFYSNI